MTDFSDVEIEPLNPSNIPELVELFTKAFSGYPLIPNIEVEPKQERRILKAILDFFMSTKNSLSYGIRIEGKLVCASVSTIYPARPPIPALIRFILSMMPLSFSLVRAYGRAAFRENAWNLRRAFWGERRKYREPHLMLVLLGTSPEYQKMGFGRKMLRFLHGVAEGRKCVGVILTTNRASPAFNLYLKEGFRVEDEFPIGDTTICWMRLPLKSRDHRKCAQDGGEAS
ncbi:MAG: GNAT family N-acetyltransferase [Nitrososphaerota archaeon]|nr:GNAT family N-acetyltransferase [Candidatus Calditenuaceae archaeon]MDW8073527.1 GNAT family N-acetyltransferase [Nitrososphaerota archaeon]